MTVVFMPNIGPAMLTLVAETGALSLLAAAATLPSDVEGGDNPS